VWAVGDQTRIDYTSPSDLAARYGFDGELAVGLAAIDAVTDAAIGSP